MPVRIGDLSFVFISYDEPRADAHWRDLLTKCPHAERVHGVRGISSAFRRAAAVASTERLVTVDGDTVVDAAFFEHALDEDELACAAVFAWPSRNAVNGLCYGNGSVKCWPRRLLLEDPTPDDRHLDHPVSFPFVFMPEVVGGCFPNGSPLQAFRAGFREGVRLGLVGGRAPGPGDLARRLAPNMAGWLRVWCSLGADAEHGRWCIYGARLGCRMAQLEGLDVLHISRFGWFDELWSGRIAPQLMAGRDTDVDALDAAVRRLGGELRAALGLDVVDLDPAESRFVRELSARAVEPAWFDMLGNAYRDGAPLPRSHEKALFNYRVAALLGNGNAVNNLARLLREGIGVERDMAEAVRLFRRATAMGNPYAPRHLGHMYRTGWGVAPDPAAAAALFELACARGFAAAHADLGELYRDGLGVARDPVRAYGHFLLAGDAGAGQREDLRPRLTGDETREAEAYARDWRPEDRGVRPRIP
ncbi:MAG TPA: tetratricopeptide repeat protein [Geminicoccaceae bacterium]|nr:tetratricopeptide repeat protein [Geminicoccaceae bacterium]